MWRCNNWLAVALVPLVAGSAGCASTALDRTTSAYYGGGPEQALDVLEQEPIRTQDRVLAAMEQAVALAELGDYEASNAALAEALAVIEAAPPDPAGWLVNDQVGGYRGEYFERVWLHALGVVNHLALQDVAAAAAAGEDAVTAIASVGCGRCRFPFTRYAAALAIDAAGRRDRAVEVLAEAVAESPNLDFLQTELDRLAGGPQSEGRTLHVLLLLGRGPVKVPSGVPVPYSHWLMWPTYLPYEGPETAWTEVATPTGEFPSVLLTDMTSLATASLRERLGLLIPKEVGKTLIQEAVARDIEDDNPGLGFLARVLFSLADGPDLRHWSTLPGSCQVVRVPLDDETRRCELRFIGRDGTRVHRETLELPAAWTDGPLFVTRRVP